MRFYNSFTRKKEEFVPIEANKVKMYVCGQTVYDYCHLGHARKSIVFDMIRRWFIASGYMVSYVENITDIDDKIINRAIESGENINQLTSKFISYMHEDFEKLGIMRPDYEPRATQYIPQMLNIISDLVVKNHAYLASNGDVYYSVRKFANYGKLSDRLIDHLRAGERVEIDNNKQDPLDFVLWKAAKTGEPYWESEFGNGRPGWHIECSAMSEELLGKNFDIHGGGQDLQFPHHENEIAQSEAHNGCKFANYWIHNGFLNINDEKMSKSLGNFFTLRDVLENYDAEVIRFFMLRTHYRSPLNFNQDGLNDAKQGLTRLYTAVQPFNTNNQQIEVNWSHAYAHQFKQAMDDDFNTPLAISVLFEICGDINKQQNLELAYLLIALANSIALVNRNSTEFFHGSSEMSAYSIEEQVNQRRLAKQKRDFITADKIRDDLLAKNIILEDKPNGTTIWRSR